MKNYVHPALFAHEVLKELLILRAGTLSLEDRAEKVLRHRIQRLHLAIQLCSPECQQRLHARNLRTNFREIPNLRISLTNFSGWGSTTWALPQSAHLEKMTRNDWLSVLKSFILYMNFIVNFSQIVQSCCWYIIKTWACNWTPDFVFLEITYAQQ